MMSKGKTMGSAARKEPCGWEMRPGPLTREQLDEILVCAAKFGCHRCVGCSEMALDRIRQINSLFPPLKELVQALKAR